MPSSSDLRSNGGGSEDTLKAFAGNFESDQVVMGDIKGRNQDEQLVMKPRRPHHDMPMYILIDSETGSAAEMFARHFQLRKKAVIVGDHSSGRVTRSIYLFFPSGLAPTRSSLLGCRSMWHGSCFLMEANCKKTE